VHADPSHAVAYASYPGALDMTGQDLISLLDHAKSDLTPMFGMLAEKQQMCVMDMPEREVIGSTGEIPDEVHDWPGATLGPDIRDLRLMFLDDRLIGLRWKFNKALSEAPRRPWYRRIFGGG